MCNICKRCLRLFGTLASALAHINIRRGKGGCTHSKGSGDRGWCRQRDLEMEGRGPIMITFFKGGCCELRSSWSPVIPGRVEDSWELRPWSHFREIAGHPADPADQWMSTVELDCLSRLWTGKLLARNWPSDVVEALLYAPGQTKAAPMAGPSAPKWSEGSPRNPKETQSRPKQTKGV